jgi:hypothetical protein
MIAGGTETLSKMLLLMQSDRRQLSVEFHPSPTADATRLTEPARTSPGVNEALAYSGYFAMIPTGQDPSATLTEGFFALAANQRPRPAPNAAS